MVDHTTKFFKDAIWRFLLEPLRRFAEDGKWEMSQTDTRADKPQKTHQT